MPACPATALLAFGMVCSVQVDRVVDGDTFKAQFGGAVRSVRVVGIDTPERGESGFAESTRAAERRFDGKTVNLIVGGARSRSAGQCVGQAVLDRYDRVLARVEGWPAAVRRWDKGPWCR